MSSVLLGHQGSQRYFPRAGFYDGEDDGDNCKAVATHKKTFNQGAINSFEVKR